MSTKEDREVFRVVFKLSKRDEPPRIDHVCGYDENDEPILNEVDIVEAGKETEDDVELHCSGPQGVACFQGLSKVGRFTQHHSRLPT